MLLYFLCMYNHHTPCLSFLADSRNHRKVFPVLLALRNLIVNFDIHTAEVFPNDFPYFRTRNVSFQTWKPLGHDNDRTSNVLVFSICFRIIYSYLSTNYASEHLTWKYTVLCSSLGETEMLHPTTYLGVYGHVNVAFQLSPSKVDIVIERPRRFFTSAVLSLVEKASTLKQKSCHF